YIDKTNNAALTKQVCMVCARLLFATSMEEVALEELPNKLHLIPYHAHPAHKLHDGYLIHDEVADDATTYACTDCLKHLRLNQRPPLALSNSMWIGPVPMQLEILELAERLLVALYFPSVYVVKLFPKSRRGSKNDNDEFYSGMRGNVSTYRLDQAAIANLVSGKALP
ncbi:hypothetical protein R3P38DRAFT_2472382, partial [Favolaschia claudopus]